MVSFPLDSRRGKKARKNKAPGGVQHVHEGPKVFAEGSMDKLAHDDITSISVAKNLDDRPHVPPALAYQHQDMDEIALTALAHEYNVPAFTALLKQIEQYRALEIPRDRLSLSIALFVLSNRNGADVAKRLHLLELADCEFSWTECPIVGEKGVPCSDLHIKCGGASFLVGSRGTKTWQAGVEFRLGLHRKEHEESKTTRI